MEAPCDEIGCVDRCGWFTGERADLCASLLHGGVRSKKASDLDGAVTGVEWQNPHTYFYMDVKDESGKIVNWRLETGSPGALMLRGWTRETIKVGDHLVVQGYRAKDIPNVAAARSVTMMDGRTIFGGQTDDGGPTR